MEAARAVDAATEEIEAALAAADVPVLLMVLVHLTGERRWIEPPFEPVRDIALFPDESGGLPEDVQATVRAAALDALVRLRAGGGELPALPPPELFEEMMSVCVGEPVPEEYVPMMLEEMGLVERDLEWRTGPDPAVLQGFHVLVIGAGVSGLCAAAKLERLGIPYTVVEKNEAVGGTWLENDYPDCGVDVPNHFYSYSFAPNPGWSSYFSKRDELRDYLERCATEFGVRHRIRFGLEATTADWDEERARWRVELRRSDGTVEAVEANALVTAAGQLNRPKAAAIEGLDEFAGPVFHSARWRHDVDLDGKRVAVVGTGASAMQIARTTAERAERLVIFQRSPQWVAPSPFYHRTVSDEKRWLLANVPYYRPWYRFVLSWRYGDGLLPSIQIDPDWEHPERSLNANNERHRQFFVSYVESQLADRPDLLSKVVPDYPPYGKRMLVDNHWFRTIARDDVDLVTDGIARVTADAVVTETGDAYPADVIVLATGFEARRMLWPLDVTGRGGRTLAEQWGEDDPRAYLGITVPAFPNLFCLYGPNTNLGHGGSIIFHAECQVRYVVGCLVRMLEEGIVSIECRQDVHDEYNRRVDEAHARMVWSHPGMTTWYRNSAGRVVTNSPWRLVDYWRMTHDPDLGDFHVRRA